MRFTLPTACLLAALASTANARPAGEKLQDRALFLNISGSVSVGAQSQAGEASQSNTGLAKSTSVSSSSKSISNKASASSTASSSKASSASKIPISSPNLSSLSKTGQSSISSASATASAKGIKSSASKSSPASATKSSSSAQASSTGCSSNSGDAPYSLSCGQLESVISFPNGFNNRPGGIIFLVHGTGSTPEESWGPGPYNTILPNKGPGYDIAWITIPNRSLTDSQVIAEYVAYNIPRLAKMSATKKIFIIGHSQGNINIQWALAFWPSARKYVTGFISLAGDFHGTAEGPLLCTAQNILQGGCSPSVFQQSVGSNYLAAQNTIGGSALVPTTSIYTIFDDIIQPEIINPTSELPGAVNLRIQDLDLCGTGHVIDHFTMLVAAGPFYLALNAIENNGVADRSAFGLNECAYLTADSTVPNPFVTVPGIIRGTALGLIAIGLNEYRVPVEPRLMPYVCEMGLSTYC